MKKPKVVGIIQARIGSNRLPGKVLKTVEGKTVLEHIVLRLMASKALDDIVVATSGAQGDSSIVQLARSKNWNVVAGDENDVITRYIQAAEEYEADVIVRVCADCIFYDPEILDQVLESFFQQDFDYASTTINRTYPRGIAVEVLWRKTLEKLDNKATEQRHREHVTLYILDNPDQFNTLSFEDRYKRFDPRWRWVIDTREDFDFACAVYADLFKNKVFTSDDIFQWVKKHPEKIIYHDQ